MYDNWLMIIDIEAPVHPAYPKAVSTTTADLQHVAALYQDQGPYPSVLADSLQLPHFIPPGLRSKQNTHHPSPPQVYKTPLPPPVPW